MKPSERLLDALGEADPALLERSEQTRRSAPWKPILAAAACLAVAVTLAAPRLNSQPTPTVTPTPVVTPPVETLPVGDPDPPVLVLDSDAQGEVLLCQGAGEARMQSDFVLIVNRELYDVTDPEPNTWVITPKLVPDDPHLPPTDLTIVHLPDTPHDRAIRDAAQALETDGWTVCDIEFYRQGMGSTFYACKGEGWDAPAMYVTTLQDEEGGCYRFVARTFLEAVEGHGVRFQNMVSTFQVVGNKVLPQWLSDLYAAAGVMVEAVLSDKVDDIAPLLTREARVDTWGEDLWGDVSISAVNFAVDDPRSPTAAQVSVAHQVSLEEACDYLTMSLVYRDGAWLLEEAVLEK